MSPICRGEANLTSIPPPKKNAAPKKKPLKKAPKKAPKIYGQWSVSGQKNLELSQWSSVVMEMLNFRSVWELVLVVMG